MDTGRDLACPELWQQSLERSLARRGKPTRSSLELFRLRPERDLARGDFLRESLMYSQLRRSAVGRRPAMSLPSAGGISALALLAATTIPGLVGGGGESGHGERVAFRPGGRGAREPAGSAHGSAGSTHGSPATSAVGLAASPGLTASAAALGTPTGDGNLAAGSPASAAWLPAKPPVAVHASSGAVHPSSTGVHASPASTHRSASPSVHAHLAVARDTTGGAVQSAGVAHAHSGGAVAAPRTSTTAPRVPGNPQPTGHPSTGGGAIAETSHGSVSAAHTPAPAAPTHPVAGPHPAAPRPVSTTRPVTTTHPVSSAHPVAKPHPVVSSPPPTTPAAPVAAGGYTNPLAGADVTPERIDQGVDYSGSGPLHAIGAGTVTYVATSGTGWPGAFIEYQLAGGPDAGRYVYYAEGVSPAAGLRVGQTVGAGQTIAEIDAGSSSGIEIGWGSGVGTQTLAEANGDWSGGDDADSVPSPEGKDFSALIASLGGPPGKIEG